MPQHRHALDQRQQARKVAQDARSRRRPGDGHGQAIDERHHHLPGRAALQIAWNAISASSGGLAPVSSNAACVRSAACTWAGSSAISTVKSGHQLIAQRLTAVVTSTVGPPFDLVHRVGAGLFVPHRELVVQVVVLQQAAQRRCGGVVLTAAANPPRRRSPPDGATPRRRRSSPAGCWRR